MAYRKLWHHLVTNWLKEKIVSKPKRPYPKGHPMYQPEAETPPSPPAHAEQKESVESEGAQDGRTRVNLSLSGEVDAVLDAAARCLGMTKAALVTGLVIQSLPALRGQVEAMRAIKG